MTVDDIYERGIRDGGFDAMHFGPAHIVWEDGNLEDSYIRWCIEHFDKYSSGLDAKDLEAVRRSLEELLLVPEAERFRQWEER